MALFAPGATVEIKAIPTRYKGYHFRSRLEARWAVFFDQLGIEYQYEPQGFDLGEAGLYLPDFYLPKIDRGYWVEIKSVEPTDSEREKIQRLAIATGKSATFRVGEPFINVLMAQGSKYDSSTIYEAAVYESDGGEDHPYLFCVCPWCGKPGIEFDGRGARVCGYRAHYDTEAEALNAIRHLGHWRADDKCYTGNHQRIIDAAYAARSARFEHGECGPT